jgi:hypothetical protein
MIGTKLGGYLCLSFRALSITLIFGSGMIVYFPDLAVLVELPLSLTVKHSVFHLCENTCWELFCSIFSAAWPENDTEVEMGTHSIIPPSPNNLD